MKEREGIAGWEEVRRRYSNDYLRHLAIEHHILELHSKMVRYLGGDYCPFVKSDFNKELADIYILLQLHCEFDEEFAELVERRRERFVEKLLYEEK